MFWNEFFMGVFFGALFGIIVSVVKAGRRPSDEQRSLREKPLPETRPRNPSPALRASAAHPENRS